MEKIIRYFNNYIYINFENKAAVKKAVRIIFLIYTIFVMYKLLLGNERIFEQEIVMANRDVFNNWIPFKTIALYFRYFSCFDFWNWVLNIFGNILIFIPFGILFPLSSNSEHKFASCIFYGFLLTAAIEITQLVTALGIFDVDDAILNMLGVLIGYGLHKIASAKRRG